jgi:hypothetical protein
MADTIKPSEAEIAEEIARAKRHEAEGCISYYQLFILALSVERDELRAEVERLKAMLDTIATGDWGALPDSMGLSCEFGEDARYNHPAREKAVRKYAAAQAGGAS